MTVDTLPALFREQADRFGPRIALRHKRHGLYHDLRWDEYRDQIEACAAALIQHGVLAGDRVAILAENCAPWLVADMAILSVGAVNVPLHAPLAAAQVQWQLDNAGVKWIFVSNEGQFAKIVEIQKDLPALNGVVRFDDDTPHPGPPPQGGREAEAITWRGFLQRGRIAKGSLHAELARRHKQLAADQLATIIYTSGTTGNPKGVMLTHGNLLSNALAFRQISPFSADSVFLNWLPFSHIYARTIDIYVTLAVGATLCLADSAETVVANLMELQPTNMSAVPRFYEKVLAAVQDADPETMHKRLRGIFGPRIDFLGSGGAPLPLGVAEAYQRAGLLLLQGYGLTESSPVISFNRRDAYRLGSVGQPIPGVEVRIGDDGEVLSRGPHIMKGYWQNPRETAASLVDGWLHTGDLGRLDDDGFLYITGRKKELLVLSNGKKVVPSHLEGLLLADACFDQVVVCGEGRNFLTALVVPHWGNLAQAMGASAEPRDPKVRTFLEGRIAQVLRGVGAWEQIRKILVLPQPFSVAADELTVSLKLRRSVIFEHHRDELEALYRE